jgi:hypothetical protein
VKIVYRVTEPDFMEGYRLYVSGEKPFRRWSRRLMPWEGGVFLAIGILSLFSTGDRVLPTVLCLAGVYLLYCGFALKRYFRRRYRSDQRFKRDITAEISEDGIHVVTETEDSQQKWNAIVRFLESDKVFIFFYSGMIFTIVPKSAFAPADLDPFRELIRRKFPSSSTPVLT